MNAASKFRSCSQAGQDEWVFNTLVIPEALVNGAFLDIGANHPTEKSNSYGLELIGWKGLLVDNNADCRDLCGARLSPFLFSDATKVNWNVELPKYFPSRTIDYLSLDVDSATEDVLRSLPLDEYRFRLLTVEHDSYRFGEEPKNRMRELLRGHGYDLIKSDVTHRGIPFEDWWGLKELLPRVEPINVTDYFDKIFVINLRRRSDRWSHCIEQLSKYGIFAERFEAYDKPDDHTGTPNGNLGCTASHRALLEIIAYHKWRRALILEDDFQIRHENFHERFSNMIREVPQDWDMLYLGGHYAEPPQYRENAHVIRIGRMLTTSSYAVTAQFARSMAPFVSGIGPIDSLYGAFNRSGRCYIFHPRLMVQYTSLSDLTDRISENTTCMEDTSHENMV